MEASKQMNPGHKDADLILVMMHDSVPSNILLLLQDPVFAKRVCVFEIEPKCLVPFVELLVDRFGGATFGWCL